MLSDRPGLAESLADPTLIATTAGKPIFTPATKDTAMYLRELTLAELLDDPMTIAVMAADRVDPVALNVVLSALSRKLRGPQAPEHERIGIECYPQPRCHRWPHQGAALR